MTRTDDRQRAPGDSPARRNRLRRAGATLAALALLAAGCGDDGGGSAAPGDDGPAADLPECPLDALDAATGVVEVVVWHTQTARPLQVLEELTAEYNASQDRVRVRLESQGASYEEIQRRFNESIRSRDLPALILVDDTFTRSMADSGVVLPAQSCIDAEGTDVSGFLEVARSYYTIDDVLWPVSANLGNILLYYNRGHFRQAGLDPADPPSSLAEVRAAAEAIKAAGVAATPLAHEFSAWKTEFWLTGAGAPMVDNDNGRGDGETTSATLADSAEALELFEWFRGMLDDGLMVGVAATPGQIDQYLALATESASMLIDTSSAATSIEAFLGGEVLDDVDLGDADVEVEGLDIVAGAFPGLREGDPTQMGGGAWYLLATVPDEVQAAAWDFASFMNSAHAQSRLLVGGSYLPYLTAAADEPEAVAYLAGESGRAGRWLAIANDQVRAIDPNFPGPLIGPYDEFREHLVKAQDDLVFGGASPQDALARAQAAIDAALQRYSDEGF
jgi:sn-glycerol 3-phosphate transport system substrate-binding protein